MIGRTCIASADLAGGLTTTTSSLAKGEAMIVMTSMTSSSKECVNGSRDGDGGCMLLDTRGGDSSFDFFDGREGPMGLDNVFIFFFRTAYLRDSCLHEYDKERLVYIQVKFMKSLQERELVRWLIGLILVS